MEPSNRPNFIEQVRTLLAPVPSGEPVVMINLLRYRDQADYGGHAGNEPCTGGEAYRRYMNKALPFVQGVGGAVVWLGSPRAVLIGPPGERWDNAFLVQYPSKEAFLDMIGNPDYQAITIHRTAALQDSRLIATTTATA